MSRSIFARVFLHIKELVALPGERIHFLLAVSGGSDSVALLHIIHSLKEKFGFSLSVVTVSHNIRDEKVSKEDAEFVSCMCSSYFHEKVPCIVVEIPKIKMQTTVKKRGKGLEEAARFLRLQAYEKARLIFGATHVLTAHTKDDFFEGVLMSFFSGASPSTLLGMKVKNGHYIKPLIDIEKQELRQYLLKKGIPWREDATNASLCHLRNKVRLSLVPRITEVFSGWVSGLEKTLSKLSVYEEYINSSYQNYLKTMGYWKKTEEGLSVDALKFLSMPRLFSLKFLQEGLILLGIKKRISYDAVLNLLDLSLKSCKRKSAGLLLYIKKDKVILTVQRKKKSQKEEQLDRHCGYSFWVDRQDCDFSFAGHSLRVRLINEKEATIFLDATSSLTLPLPFCIRSRMLGDFITINGKKKTLKSIFSKMGVSSKMNSLLPIVEIGGVVKVVYASIIGKKNLIGEIENK